MEPPPDLEDEDEMLCAMYEHAYGDQSGHPHHFGADLGGDRGNNSDDDSDDLAWVWDKGLLADEERTAETQRAGKMEDIERGTDVDMAM